MKSKDINSGLGCITYELRDIEQVIYLFQISLYLPFKECRTIRIIKEKGRKKSEPKKAPRINKFLVRVDNTSVFEH